MSTIPVSPKLILVKAVDKHDKSTSAFDFDAPPPASSAPASASVPGLPKGATHQDIIHHPNFLNWFGDWRSKGASPHSAVLSKETGEPQVTHGDGSPKVVYHGTASGGFQHFDDNLANPLSLYGAGHYFTEDKDVAKTYQEKDANPQTVLSPEAYHHLNEFIHQELPDDWEHMPLHHDNTPNSSLLTQYHPKTNAILQRSGFSDRLEGVGRSPLHIPKKLGWDKSTTRKWTEMAKKHGWEEPTEHTPEIKSVYLNIRKPMPIDETLTPEHAHNIADALDKHYEQEPYKGGSLAGKKPSDHLRQLAQETADTNAAQARGVRVSGSIHHNITVENALKHISNGVVGGRVPGSNGFVPLSPQHWPKLLQHAGYDGITHVGGDRMGGGHHHRVWIAFHGNQVKHTENDGSFSPETHDMYKAIDKYDGTFDPNEANMYKSVGHGKTYSWCNRCSKASHWSGEDCPLCGASMERAGDLEKPMRCAKGHIFDAHGSDEGDPNQCPRCSAMGTPLSKAVGGLLILVVKAVDKVGGKANMGFDFDAEPHPLEYGTWGANFLERHKKHLFEQLDASDESSHRQIAQHKQAIKEMPWSRSQETKRIELAHQIIGDNAQKRENLHALTIDNPADYYSRSYGSGERGLRNLHYAAVKNALARGSEVPAHIRQDAEKNGSLIKAVDKRDTQTHGMDLFGSDFDAASLRSHAPSPKVPLPKTGKGRFRGKMPDGLDDDETLLDRLDASAHETRQMEVAHAGQLSAGHDTSLRYEMPKPKKTHWDAPIYVNGKPVPIRTPPHNDLLKSLPMLTGQTRASLILVSKGVMSKQFLNEVTAHAAPHYVTRQMIRDGLAQARTDTNHAPTPAQKEAGNYKKGKITLHGLTIAIENPKGSNRCGVAPDGKAWSIKMQNDYGYVTRVAGMGRPKGKTNPLVGRDGDKVDVFIGPHPHAELAYIVDAVNQNGRFDEHKTIVGALSEDEARGIYLANYQAGWRCGKITALTMGQFKNWLMHGDKQKPVADTNAAPFGKSFLVLVSRSDAAPGVLVPLVKSVVDKSSVPTGVPHPASPNLGGLQNDVTGHRWLAPEEQTKYQSVVNKLHPFIRVPHHVLPQILKEGRFKSQFETGSSSGVLNHEMRANTEKMLFDMPHDAPHEHRPIYGYLHQNPNGLRSRAEEDTMDETDAPQYGDVIVRLKNHMKDRTTFTKADSLGANLDDGGAPSHYHAAHVSSLPYDTMATRSFAKGRKAISPNGYTEAQYWGGVHKDDIDHVILPEKNFMTGARRMELEAACHAHGIPLRRNVTATSKFKDGLHLPPAPASAAPTA